MKRDQEPTKEAGGKKTPMVSKSAYERLKTKGEEKLKRIRQKGTKERQQLMRTANHAGQHGVTLSTAASLSYAEGRYGRDYMEPGGVKVRRWVGGAMLIGGLAAEAMDYDTVGGYVAAVGAGAVISDACSSALSAGQAARAKAEAGKGSGATAPAADPLLNNMQATPANNGGSAAGQRGNRPKHRVQPNRRHAEVPPHLQHLFRQAHAA